MMEKVNLRFRGSCMMLMQRRNDSVEFLGSCFLVRSSGYLLTTARTIPTGAELLAVPPETEDRYPTLTRDDVAPIPVDIIGIDHEHDIALLKLQPELKIQMPSDIIGDADEAPRGSLLMSIGVPFGYHRVHTVLAPGSVLAGRARTANGSHLLIFDRRVQYGDSGGPLIRVSDGSVIGIVGGLYDPVHFGGGPAPDGVQVHPDFSYAISIRHAVELMLKYDV